MKFDALSEMEKTALDKVYDGACGARFSISVGSIPSRNVRDPYGFPRPGLGVFRKLARKGLVLFTEEDLMDPARPELGTWTPSVEMTDEGRALLEASRKECRP